MNIIGLTGRAGSGKDTAGQMIIEWCNRPTYNVPAARYAFADNLKVSAARSLGFDGDLAECIAFCDSLKRCGQVTVNAVGEIRGFTITGRQFLQRYGTESHRDVFGEWFWTDALLKEISEDVDGVAVITDVRFDNEAEAIHDRGGVIWQINRPTDPSAADDTHSSEQAIMGELVDLVIDNSGSLDELRQTVGSLAIAHIF